LTEVQGVVKVTIIYFSSVPT